MTKGTPSKDELELQKLALEIRELQRLWWQRPVYLSILLPIVLGTLTVLAGILSGYFDRERTELRRNVQALKRENSALLETQAAIRQANADAQKQLMDLMTIKDWAEKMHHDRFEEFLSEQKNKYFSAPTASASPESGQK